MKLSPAGACALVLTAVLTFLPACHKTAEEPPTPVVIQLSSIENQEQLARRVEALKARGFTGTIKVAPEKADPAYLKSLVDQGFEFMGIVYWTEGDTYEQQLKETLAKTQALEAATGRRVVGFSPQGGKFNRGNENTYAVLQAMGARYIHQSARYEAMPAYALEPYKAPGYDLIVCPMQSRGLWNVGTSPFDQTVLAMSGSN
jgi:hypothetical protein